jgi:hypothetical protein
VSDAVNQLLATEAALDKLGARGISTAEAERTLWNRHVVVKNRRGCPERGQREARRLLIGQSNANRVLTLVIEETVEPTTWLLRHGVGLDACRAYDLGEVMSRLDHDPLPGDFDKELTDVDPADIQVVEPSHGRRLVVQFTLDGDDAAALQKIAHDQGERPGEVVRSLIRAASDRAA